jgi:hypothetical protein
LCSSCSIEINTKNELTKEKFEIYSKECTGITNSALNDIHIRNKLGNLTEEVRDLLWDGLIYNCVLNKINRLERK